ncbi:hypothetical protein JTE90_005826 [Oedothorax gibbosus]|uniref:SLC41A/MgtE integral membrane domain-containing protein n=1 Tax=Oedothorax gibbosus TaxID=931172 RepID=A0AAV6V4G5_9ARAC|nr:hypothetical protein JTE90_005826 [Oedothorax gibbosus]
MVPRAASEGDQLIISDSSDEKEFANLTEFGKPDIINALVPNALDKDSKPVSWTFDGDQSGTDNESHRSLLEEQVVIPDTKETMLAIALQVFVPFLIAGFGTVGAGLVLDIVQHWDVFKVVSEIFILVPALLGLKGNLEMTLASRLSTQANLGHMDTSKEQWKLASGNMALIQCQAIVVGFLASLFAMIMGWIPEGKFNLEHALLLCAASLVTASLASLILGCIMVGVVICSRKCHINPDNVATPIAASLGDLTTLSLLAGISYVLYGKLDSPGFPITIILFFLLLLPFWIAVARKNKYTREVLHSGWTPVISAMAISSVGGCILDFAVDRFYGIAVFQPVINGVGGNLVAVQASRISTYLHQRSKLGVLPVEDKDLCKDPISAFFGKSVHSTTARVLMLMVVPGHLVFTYGIRFFNAGHTSVTAMFLTFYLLAAIIQVFLLLYFAHVMVHWMWIKHIDPDNSAIPYLTALGDLLGTALLAAAFVILYELGDKDFDVGE